MTAAARTADRQDRARARVEELQGKAARAAVDLEAVAVRLGQVETNVAAHRAALAAAEEQGRAAAAQYQRAQQEHDRVTSELTSASQRLRMGELVRQARD